MSMIQTLFEYLQMCKMIKIFVFNVIKIKNNHFAVCLMSVLKEGRECFI